MSSDPLKTHIARPKDYFVAIGTLIGGFEFYGPFRGPMTAKQWITDNVKITALSDVRIHEMYKV